MLESVADVDLQSLADAAHGDASGDRDVSELRYEVMFLLEADDALIPAFKDVWSGVGDSIVVVGGDGLWNCHIHADDIGEAIEAALETGRPRRIGSPTSSTRSRRSGGFVRVLPPASRRRSTRSPARWWRWPRVRASAGSSTA